MKVQPVALVLASGSQIRKNILESAGLVFSICPPAVDESAIKRKNPELSPNKLALLLAKTKALANNHGSDAFVIGADQILEVDGCSLDKLTTMEQAKERLWSLRNREHFLTGAVVIAQNGQIIWENQQRSRLVMTDFSQTALDAVLQQAKTRILASVGCYELEAEGIRLFREIDGDHTAMLGLPILPVLAALRQFGGLVK